ncbi:hypothetical protein Acsp05_47260 [Actinokineospora sp. NBRC 105648]|nr:hypothetical protein Acsp05_47260 [Actinokineospora sp. NBRC 105648]
MPPPNRWAKVPPATAVPVVAAARAFAEPVRADWAVTVWGVSVAEMGEVSGGWFVDQAASGV